MLGEVKWLRLSAEQGMQDAQYLFGKAYMRSTEYASSAPRPDAGKLEKNCTQAAISSITGCAHQASFLVCTDQR
jgi:hypothetical protein